MHDAKKTNGDAKLTLSWMLALEVGFKTQFLTELHAYGELESLECEAGEWYWRAD